MDKSSVTWIPQVSWKQMAGERQERGKGFSTSPTIIRDQRLHTRESYHSHSQQRVQFQSWLFSSRHQQILQDANVQLCSPSSYLPNTRTNLCGCWLPPPLCPETHNESWPGDLLTLLSPLLGPVAPKWAWSLDPFLCILAAFPFLLLTGVHKFAFPIWSTKSFAIQGSP